MIWLTHMEVGQVRILHPDFEEFVKYVLSKLILFSFCKLKGLDTYLKPSVLYSASYTDTFV